MSYKFQEFSLNGLTIPSSVTAANTVEEYGAQATSPTGACRSKMNSGVLGGKNHILACGLWWRNLKTSVRVAFAVGARKADTQKNKRGVN